VGHGRYDLKSVVGPLSLLLVFINRSPVVNNWPSQRPLLRAVQFSRSTTYDSRGLMHCRPIR
jgi:hypothetical protein